MILVRLPKEKEAEKFVRLFKKSVKEGFVIGDVARSDTSIYFIVPDEALSTAFVYGIFERAKKDGLNVNFIYGIPLDPDNALPEDVKIAGSALVVKRRLRGKKRAEIVQSLKNRFVTLNVLEVLLK